MSDAPSPVLATPRIEIRNGRFVLVVRGVREGEELHWGVQLVFWDSRRRRPVAARRHAATHVVFTFLARWGARRGALLEWHERIGREYGFLDDPHALAGLLRRARPLPPEWHRRRDRDDEHPADDGRRP